MRCIDCGKSIERRNKRCWKCYNSSRERKVRCVRCGLKFKASPSQCRKYCSKSCEGLSRLGANNHFYGKTHSFTTKEKISKANKGLSRNSGHQNPMWKGDNVDYPALHQWIRRHKPKPKYCEICNKSEPIEVALIANQHKRDIRSYIWVCIQCHRNMDKGWKWNETQKEKLRKIAKERKRDKLGRFKNGCPES